MSVAVFILVVFISFIIVRIGAIAFQLTGMHWPQAKFQALSCFTGTGFTTREAELIVGHRQRRRIASILMVLGNAGLVVLIATLADSLRPSRFAQDLLEPLLPFWMPEVLVPLVNLLIIVGASYVILKFFNSIHISDRITSLLRRTLLRKHVLESLSLEEPILSAGNVGVVRITIGEGNPLIERELSAASIGDIRILALETGGRIVPNPDLDLRVAVGDTLLCFGTLAEIRNRLLKSA